MNLVTIATFSSSFDLHVIKGRLEADGITCYVKDEQTVTWDPLLDIAVGGIKLQVVDSDVEQAKLLLKDTSYNQSSSISGTTINSAFKRKLPLGAKLVLLILILTFIGMAIGFGDYVRDAVSSLIDYMK